MRQRTTTALLAAAMLATAMLATGLAVASHALADTPAAITVPPVPTEPKPTGPVIRDPHWLAAPTAADIDHAWPAAAHQAGSGGRAALGCFVQADGTVGRCRLLGEAPVGQGFGDAALSLSRLYRMDTTGAAGAAMVGRGVRLPFSFGTPPVAASLPPPTGRAPVAASRYTRPPFMTQAAVAPPPPEIAAIGLDTGPLRSLKAFPGGQPLFLGRTEAHVEGPRPAAGAPIPMPHFVDAVLVEAAIHPLRIGGRLGDITISRVRFTCAGGTRQGLGSQVFTEAGALVMWSAADARPTANAAGTVQAAVADLLCHPGQAVKVEMPSVEDPRSALALARTDAELGPRIKR